MRLILIVYGIILLLGLISMLTKIHYFANIAGFIAAVGFMLVFFKDVPKTLTLDEKGELNKFKKYWYFVFSFGVFFSLLFGSLWNNQMGGMAS